MSLSSIPGNGFLICPKGVGYGTLDEELWNNMNNPSWWSLHEISAALFANWVCNLKVVDLNFRMVDYTPENGAQEFESDFEAHMITPYVAMLGGADEEPADPFNNPFPLNYLDNNGKLNLHALPAVFGQGGSYYKYYVDGDGWQPLPATAEVPSPFIRDDKFYMAFPIADTASNTVSISMDEISHTTVQDFGEGWTRTWYRTWTARSKFF